MTNLSPEEWSRIDRFFDAALQRPEADRAAWVEQVCGDDRDVREAVLALLEAEDKSRGLLGEDDQRSMRAALDELAIEALTKSGELDLPFDRIGRYRLVEEIGRGGWGTVYRAVRDVGDFDQEVAIKVLRRGLDTEDVLARFGAERQILASLNHPGIARLLDGGATADGRPYLVMELVAGRSITEHCAESSKTVRERLELFIAICRAVQYAHRNLVVHRDLKPGNILVTEDGDVKLLDFGIAKLLDPGAAAAGDAPLTRTGTRPMTPDYASPEQLHGAPVTTASDIYQLGLLLYELLAGCRPFSHTTDGRQSDVSSTRDDPLPPSTALVRVTQANVGSSQLGPTSSVADAKRRARMIRGDLDTIALKALRREPERRYATVAALIDDIERYLDGRPVLARADTWSYRTWKLLRRRPGAVTAGIALVLAAGVYTGTLRAHAGQLERERNIARSESEKAGRVADFLRDVFTLTGPNSTRGELVTARELLDEAAIRAEASLEDQPQVRAALLSSIAGVYQEYGVEDRALELYTRAIATRDPVAEENAADHASDLRAVAWLLERDDPLRSDSLYREALDFAERHLGPSHPVIGRILTDFGHSLSFRGAAPREEVWGMYERALRILRAAENDVRSDLAHLLTISAYGWTPGETWFDGSTGIDRMRESLDLRIALLGEVSIDVAAGMSDLALAMEQVDSEESVRLLRRAVEIMDRLVQKRHPLALVLISNLAAVHLDRDEPDLAEPLFREVITLYDEVSPADPSRAYPLSHLGNLLNGQERPAEAEPLLREALDRFNSMQLPQDDVRILGTRARLARALRLQRRFEQAEEVLLAADSHAHAAGGPEGTDRVLAEFVALYEAWGRDEAAENWRAELEAHGSGV